MSLPLLYTVTAAGNSISSESWTTPVTATGTVWKRQAVRPVQHVKKHTLLGHLPRWCSPLAVGFIVPMCIPYNAADAY